MHRFKTLWNIFFYFIYKVVPLFIFTLFISCSIKLAIAGDFHTGTENLLCSDCHTMHYSQDDIPPEGSGLEGPYPQLLKNLTNEMCLFCHDGFDTDAPNVMGEDRYIPSAGKFGTTRPGRQHSLGSTDPPPGYSGQWNGGPLTCVSCHNPHGNGNYRNLRQDPGGSINITVTYETGPTYGGEVAIQQLAETPLSEHYKVENIEYRQSESGINYGLSEWCAGCHTDFYGYGGISNMGGSPLGDTQTSDTDTWIRHPTIGITLSEGVTNEHIDRQADNGLGYWWSTQILSRLPFISPSGEIGTKSSSDNEVGCISCHKAHGSDQLFCLIFDNPETSDLEDGTRLVGTCQACHLRGGGYYETSPHGNPDSGLQRRTRWDIGECKHCHDQHRGNPYNLFTANTNALCYTADCHDFTPTGGYAGYPAQEEDRAPWTSEYPGYFEYFFGGTKATGLNNRVRWPGQDVFENPNTYDTIPPTAINRYFSPHRNDPDMPRKDSEGNGLCVNCHSPHGTDSPFDMLNKTYLSTTGSRNGDIPVNYELCFSCHGSDGPAGMDEETKRIADYYDESINPNSAGHMIRKSTKSATYWPSHIQKGDKLACSNCHNPHGSRGYSNNNQPNARLLSDQRPQWNDLVDTLSNKSKCRSFCFGCHIPSDDPNCSMYPSGCPEVDGIMMAPIPVLPGGNSAHLKGEDPNQPHCGNCHGKDYGATNPASPAFNVHNPKPSPQLAGPGRMRSGGLLQPPSGLIANGGKRLVELVWGKYTDENIRGYHIYRSRKPGGPYEMISSEPDSVNRYLDTDVSPERNYYYVLMVEDLEGNKSPYSEEVGATPMSITPGELMTLEEIKGLTGKIKDGRIMLTWEESADALVTGYDVFRRSEDGEKDPLLLTKEGPLSWPVYEDEDVVDGKSYIYSVVAVDKMGNRARFPREIRVVYKSLYIASISLSQGDRPVRGGEEMTVLLTGSSGGSAFFYIKGLTGHIPMEEIENSGTYMGKYLVPDHIENLQASIICYLEDSRGKSDTMAAPLPIIIDNIPPPAPENLKTTVVPNGDVDLYWSTGEGRSEIATYRIYRNTGDIVESQSNMLIASDLSNEKTEFKDLKTKPDTRYRYILTSVDMAGNESSPSNVVEVLVPPDTTRPDITDMFVIDGMGVWRLGETIRIVMIGEPECEARFSIGSEIKDVLMQETFEGGKYEGRYTFKDGDEGYEMSVLGSLTDTSGNTTTYKPRFSVSVLKDSGGGPRPEVYEIIDNSFQLGGGEGLVEDDVLKVRIRGTPECTAIFNLGAFWGEDQLLTIDWSGFRESEYADITGYQIYQGTGSLSFLDEKDVLSRLTLGQKQFNILNDQRRDPDSSLYVAALDLNGHPSVISTPKWNIPLNETEEKGIYEGEYSIKPGDKMIQGFLYVSLRDKSGKSSISHHSHYPITIDTGSRIDIEFEPPELKADNLSRSHVTIKLSDIKGHGVPDRKVDLTLFTTSEYTGLVGLGKLDSRNTGFLADMFPRTGMVTGIGDVEPYVFISDDFGEIELDYQSGFAAKTVIFHVRDQITGDVELGYCTSFINAQTQVEQYLPKSRMRALDQAFNISLSASPEWLTADGISTSKITAIITDQGGKPVRGHNIKFDILTGDGHLRKLTMVTNEAGIAKVTYVAGTAIGTVEIRAVDLTARIEGKIYIRLKSDAPAICSITAEPERIPADGMSQCRLHITVTDINGNPSRGVGLALSVIKGGGNIVTVDEVTDFMGRAEAVYQTGIEPGMALFDLRITSKIPAIEELEEIRWIR